MAATIVSKSTNHVHGDQRMTATDVTLDNSYTTGGYAVSAAQLGLNRVDHTIPVVSVAGAGSVVAAHYTPSLGLLQALTATGEVANATDVSAVTIRITAWGY